MSQPNAVIGNTEGLATHPNELTARPGTVAVADNIEFAREGVAQRRKGFKNFSSGLPDFTPDQLLAGSGTSQPYLSLDDGLWYLDTSDNTWKRKDGYGSLLAPKYIWISADGDIYGTIQEKHVVVKIDISTGRQTIIGGVSGVSGSTNGVAGVSLFNAPRGLWGDNNGMLYVCDAGNHTIRSIDLTTNTAALLAGTNGTSGTATGAAGVGRFNGPWSLIGDGVDLYVVDRNNHAVRSVAISTGVISNYAGTVGTSGTANGAVGVGRMFEPQDIDMLDNGDFLVADTGNLLVRTIAGGTLSGFSSGISSPYSVCVDLTYAYAMDSTGARIERAPLSTGVFVDYIGHNASSSAPPIVSGAFDVSTAEEVFSMKKFGDALYYTTSNPTATVRCLMVAYLNVGTTAILTGNAIISSGYDSSGTADGILVGPS